MPRQPREPLTQAEIQDAVAKIRAKQVKLRANLEKLQTACPHPNVKLRVNLEKLQTACPHPNVKKTYKSNTGNYDPSADCYWIDFACPDCGKCWSVDT